MGIMLVLTVLLAPRGLIYALARLIARPFSKRQPGDA